MQEMYYGMIPEINHNTLAYRAAVIQTILGEANYFASRLKLPTPHPIQMRDIKMEYTWVAAPWINVIRETNDTHDPVSIFGSNIYNSDIPREARLRALKIGADGTIETTNFFFSVYHGRLAEVMRISEHGTERYARDLDQLVGKTSLINEAQAHQLATQWLAAVNVDVAALEKQKWTVNQLHYLPQGATNTVALPLYYVDFAWKHYHYDPKTSNLKDMDEPSVRVEILGTTKELQDISIHDGTFSSRSLLLITNALDLARMHDPPAKKLASLPSAPSNSLNKAQELEDLEILLMLKNELESLPPGRTNSPDEKQQQQMLLEVRKRLESSPFMQTNSSSPNVR